MNRTTLVALALLAAPTAFAGGHGRRPSRNGDAPTAHNNTTSEPTMNTAACDQYVTPAHRQVVELRYIAGMLPRGPIKRDAVARLDALEAQTAGAARSFCGITDLDRSPPANLPQLDAASLAVAAGAVGSVFGQDFTVNEDGLLVRVADMLMGTNSGANRRAAPNRAPNTRRGGSATDDVAFEALLASVQAAPFADDKKAALTSGAEGKTFTCTQVSQLLGAIPFADSRVEMGAFLYPAISNPDAFEDTVVAGLPFEQEKDEMRAAVAPAPE